MVMSLRAFNGVIVPLVTPLADRDALDVEGLGALLERVIRGGVGGIFILGTTGEAPSLSYRLRRRLIDLTMELVAGRVPVLVGVSDTAFVESVALARHAADAGAAAVVATAPYYFTAGQSELAEYFEHLCAEIPLPFVLYNMPGMTKVSLELATLRRLTAIERIIGLKDSSGDMDYFREALTLRQARQDWFFLTGPEHLLIRSTTTGGDGGVNGGANLFPELFVRAHRAAVAGDGQSARACQQQIEELGAIYEIGRYASRHIKATKAALSALGVCSDRMAEPFRHFLPPERRRLEEILGRFLERHPEWRTTAPVERPLQT